MLHRLDPRVKLAYALLGITLLLITARLDVLAGVLIVTHIFMLIGGVPLKHLWGIWRGLILLILIILVLQPLFVQTGDTLTRIGPISITDAGLISGVRYALRLSTAAFVVAVPLASTPMHTLVRGMEKLGLPYTLGMVIGLALHYLATLGELYHTITEAQQARGWDLAQGSALKRARAAIPTLVALIIAALRLGDSLALGLAGRGFGMPHPRTVYRDIAMTGRDWAALIGLAGIFSAVLIWLLI